MSSFWEIIVAGTAGGVVAVIGSIGGVILMHRLQKSDADNRESAAVMESRKVRLVPATRTIRKGIDVLERHLMFGSSFGAGTEELQAIVGKIRQAATDIQKERATYTRHGIVNREFSAICVHCGRIADHAVGVSSLFNELTQRAAGEPVISRNADGVKGPTHELWVYAGAVGTHLDWILDAFFVERTRDWRRYRRWLEEGRSRLGQLSESAEQAVLGAN